MVTAAIADLERSAWRGADAAGRKRHARVALVVDRDPEVETRTVGIDRAPGPVERVDEGPATDEIGLFGIADGSIGDRVGEEAEQLRWSSREGQDGPSWRRRTTASMISDGPPTAASRRSGPCDFEKLCTCTVRSGRWTPRL